MTLVKWNPFRELNALHEDMNRLFSRLDQRRFDGGEVGGRQLWTLAMDVIETDNAIRLKAALPGIDPKDISVQVEDNVLTVSAQRQFEEKVEEGKYYWVEQQYGTFSRSVTLPQSADTDHIEAHYQNGVLELTVPKREEAKRRKIELTVSSSEPKAIEAGTPGTQPAGTEQPTS